MKKQILTVVFAVAASLGSYAQCDKKIVLTASSTEYLNSNNELQKTDEETTVIEYDSKEIVIKPGEHTMEGTISSITCEWKTPFREGKTVIKAVISRPSGETMNMIITIEGKDGKNVLVGEFEGMPDRKVRLTLDKFEEKK